jgi:peroxiredoxin Q/BCP
MADKPASGDVAPELELNDQDGQTVKLSDFKGHWTVLYFYPKDNTSG